MAPRRISMLAIAAGLTVAACGSSDPQTSPVAPDVSSEPSTAPVADDVAGSSDASTDPADADEQPVAADAELDATSDTPATESVATEAPAEVADESADASQAEESQDIADSTPPIGGRALATEVDPAAQFDGNPFPDLVVADVGREGEANLANLLPSDRPILLWAWAPH